MKKTVYCLLPNAAQDVFVDTVNKRVIMITPQEDRTIKVQLDKASFRDNFCSSCSLRITEKDLVKSMKEAKIMTSSLNKISYCNNNNVCTSSDQMLALCPAGNTFTKLESVSVKVPDLVWVYNWDITGKEQFKLYALKERNGDDELFVKPYLLSNVYSKPLACISWPKNQTRPSNLKQAYYTYWDSPFSDESWVVKPNQTYIQHLQSYNPFEESESKIITLYDTFKFNGEQGIFYSEDDKILKDIPRRINNLNHVLGSFRAGANNNWLVTINNHLFNKTGKLSGTAKLNLLG